MNDHWLRTTFSACVIVLWTATAHAQQPTNWDVEIASGATATTGDIGDRLNGGWNLGLGAGYRFNEIFDLEGNFAFNGLGVSDQVLRTLQVPDGDASLMSLTVGPRVNIPIANRVRGYLAAGAGWYRRKVEFLSPTVGVVDIIDPWWGYLGSAIVPANQVLGSVSDNAFGVNGGGGVAVLLGRSGTEAFVEIRYHHADTNPTATSIVPVTFGLRFARGR
jgi:hypothetical protein